MQTRPKLYSGNPVTAQTGNAYLSYSTENQQGLHRFFKMWISMLEIDIRWELHSLKPLKKLGAFVLSFLLMCSSLDLKGLVLDKQG